MNSYSAYRKTSFNSNINNINNPIKIGKRLKLTSQRKILKWLLSIWGDQDLGARYALTTGIFLFKLLVDRTKK